MVSAVISALAIGEGAANLEFANNYRVFFSDENPELTAFENLQATYTKNDNFLFVLEPSNGDAFSTDPWQRLKSLPRQPGKYLSLSALIPFRIFSTAMAAATIS